MIFYRKTNKTAKTDTSFNQKLTKQSFWLCSITLLPSIKKTSASPISLRNLFLPLFIHTAKWEINKIMWNDKAEPFFFCIYSFETHQNHFTCACTCVVTKSCPTLCDRMDCSPPGSYVHVISLARILEWVVISFYKDSSWPSNWAHISSTGGFFISKSSGKHLTCTYFENACLLKFFIEI